MSFKCIATIQEGHQAERLRGPLAAKLRAIAAAAFGGRVEDSEVVWKVIPKGYGWTAGKPSRSSILLCVVPDSLPFTSRANVMRQIHDMWIATTGARASELLIVTHGTTL